MISIEEARQIIADHVQPLDAARSSLADAWGAVLAEDLPADADYPSADRSTMDGYVIGPDEMPGSFRLIGEIPAGTQPRQVLKSGETLRIFTGAVIPEGGGRVIMQEDVRREGNRVLIDDVSGSRFIRPKGSEATAGQILLPARTRLGGAELAILAQVGAVSPRIIRRPIIRHLATGGELVSPDQQPDDCQIRETNSSLLKGLIKALGGDLTDPRRVADDPEAIAHIAEGDWDLLLISGGASVGDYDFGAEALRRLGFTIHFDRVNLRPGKPLTFATRGRQVALLIPGNPVSHFVCFHVAIRLAFERLAGLRPTWDFLQLPFENPELLTPFPRETFWPAHVSIREGKLVLVPKNWSSSGNTFSLAGTNALARVNADSPANGRVLTLLLDALQ